MTILSESAYNTLAGKDWPSYQDYLQGNIPQNVKQELDNFARSEPTTKSVKVIKINPSTDQELLYKRQVANLPSVKTHITNHCWIPWNTISINPNGDIFLCGCIGWLPFSVGNVVDFDSFESIWASAEAQKIQKSITDKTYEFCDTRYCGIEVGVSPRRNNAIHVELTIDRSCNISCPSCREHPIFIDDQNFINEKIKEVDILSSWIDKTSRTVFISLGGGDPFASILYKQIIERFAENTRISFDIGTNGLLLLSHAHILNKIIDRTRLFISIDAATKKTYERVRRGGKWNQLLKNLEFIRSFYKSTVSASFVIQQDNFCEMLEFVQFCKIYNLKPVFSLLQDWGTWHDFDSHCVHIPTSPNYAEFQGISEKVRALGISVPRQI